STMTWHQDKALGGAPTTGGLRAPSIPTVCLVILAALASQGHLQQPHKRVPQPCDHLLQDDSQLPSVDEHARHRSKRQIETKEIPPEIHDVTLDDNDTHHLYWRVDYQNEEVRFEVHSRATSSRPWLALGFSDRGDLPGSDLCILWTNWLGKVYFE
ncbi:unnamed protein product, partial [Meganyctiphanes norvegica]